MKRFVGFALSIAIIISCCGTGAFAASVKKDNPTILISGFLCSQLYMNYGQLNEERVWGLDMSRAADRAGDILPSFIKSFAGLALKKTEDFGKAIGDGAAYILEFLRCNPDGTSAYPVSHYPNDPAKSNLKYMYENNLTDKLYEKSFCEYISTLTDPALVYCFQYDSRLDAVTVAEQLHDFIKNVKAYTCADKVNIFALSFGGLITSTYLSLYTDDCDADNVVMSVPAIGGTNIPDRLLRGKIDFPAENLIMFFETILKGEGNLARIFEGSETESLNAIISSACDGFSSVFKYWGSIWSLCSTELYEDLKNDFLDPVESKELIEKNDRLHYEIRPYFRETFEKCMEKGVSVSILCATGSSLVVGGELNGDVILPVSGVSGATCAPIGQRFPDGYTGIKTVCDNSEHNHVSPSLETDASSAYLPENTWFIESQYHGQYFYEEYTRSLVSKLLLTDEIKDVHSHPLYPQFEYSNHSYRSLHAKFNNSRTGYLDSDDHSLIVENLSTHSYIKILSVISNGVDLDFDASETGLVSPGESVAIPFEGDLPEVGATAAQITVNYIKIGSINPLCTADFDIMIDNGDVTECGSEFVENDFESRLENFLPEKVYDFIVRHSLRPSLECIYNSVTNLTDR